MNLKRVISALIGTPLVVLLFVFGNVYIFDCVIAILAVISLYEYTNCFKNHKKG